MKSRFQVSLCMSVILAAPKTSVTPSLFLPRSSFPSLTPIPTHPTPLTIDWLSVSVYVDSDPFRPLLSHTG